MSLPAYATTTAMVYALRGATLAGEFVFDSPIEPIELSDSANKPIICIYADVDKVTPDGVSFLQGERRVDIFVQILLPAEVDIVISGTSKIIESRDSGARMALDIMYRQIERTLMSSQSRWAILFRESVSGFLSVDSRPYILQTAKGNRIAAREIGISCHTLYSPAIGEEDINPFWTDFVTAMRAESDLAGNADLIEAEIRGEEILPEWRQVAATLGLNQTDMASIGLGPLGSSNTADDEVPMVMGTLDDKNTGVIGMPKRVMTGPTQMFEDNLDTTQTDVPPRYDLEISGLSKEIPVR